MSADDFIVPPQPAPALSIPQGSGIVTVRIIDSTTRLSAPLKMLFEQTIEGLPMLSVPSFSFLVSNGNRHILYDLGTRKDYQNLSPAVVSLIKLFSGISVEKNVAEILEEHAAETGISTKDIEAVIWSHHHFDHTGDISTFPSSTDLVVGPGFMAQYGPGYPKDENSQMLVSDFEGRKVRELSFEKESKGSMLGSLAAIDFFGDGSFYLLDTPGHTCGHMSALARVTASPDSFVFMGGDVAHSPAVLKPSPWHPLPKMIKPSPIPSFVGGCPGEILQRLHPKGSASEPFFTPSRHVPFNADDNERSVGRTQEVDALKNILVVLAHDAVLGEYLDFFPKTINDWYAKDLDNITRWAFVRDFSRLVDEVKL